MRHRAAAGALALSVLLAACSTSGQQGSSQSSSATDAASGSASASPSSSQAVPQGAAVTTTSSDVAGFSLSQHQVVKTVDSPDRLSVSSSALPPGFASPPPGSGRQRYLSQKITWTSCGSDQCAKVLVPLDWDHPDGQAITLAMRKKASDGPRTATLFVNPGGPGGSGQDMVSSMDASEFSGHDIIGWDPRGSGESTPVRCGSTADTDSYVATDVSPDSSAEWTRLLQQDEKFATQCRQASGALLDHISTIDNVRDLDYLRYLVGDKKLDYLGISYGTYVGALYAEMYPQRSGRLVLDSAVNITQDDSVIQAMGFDLALKNYATWCAKNQCALGSTQQQVLSSVTRLLNQLDTRPITVEDRELVQSLGVLGTMTFLYMGADAYDQLTQALVSARNGDGSLLLAAADLMNSRRARGDYGSLLYSFPAIGCADTEDRGISDDKNQYVVQQKKAPVLGRLLGADLVCAVWTAHPAPTLHITAKGAAPIVVLGATGDPATPYQQAVSMAKQLDSGVLVTWRGAGHSAWELGNSCVKDAVDGYITKGTVPANGLTC